MLGATILPYKGAIYWTPEGEAARQRVNALHPRRRRIRRGDRFRRRGARSRRSRADPGGFHSGDFLHGSDAGYRAMAEAVPLALFAARDWDGHRGGEIERLFRRAGA